MAPTKTTKACKAMKPYGISGETVKSVLKDLLRVYDRNWKYIEDENYRVLLDAIFDSQESKREEVKEQEIWSRDESKVEVVVEEEEEWEQPLKKSRLRKQSSCTSSPIADDSSPRFSIISSFQNQHREDEIQMSTLCTAEDYEGKGKKPQMSSVVGQAEASQVFVTAVKSDCDILSPERQWVSPIVFQRKKRSTSERSNYNNLCEPGTRHNGKACLIELPQFEVPLAIIYPDHSSLSGVDGSSNGNLSERDKICLESPTIIHLDAADTNLQNRLDEHGYSNGNHSAAKRNRLIFPDKIDLDEENSPSERLYEDGSSDRNFFGSEGNTAKVLNSKHVNTEDNEDDSPASSQIDIASSLNGEVKLSFIYRSPRPREFQIPSLAAVLKQVEDKYRKSLGTSDPGISLSKLLKGMCECFLEQVTAATDTEQVLSAPRTMKNSTEQAVISIMSNGAVPCQKFAN